MQSPSRLPGNGSGDLEPSTGGVTGACSIFPTCHLGTRFLCYVPSSLPILFLFMIPKFIPGKKFGPFEPILGDDYRQEGVLFDGSLYFTTSEPFSIACFDLESGRWERLDSELPGDLTFVRLVSDGENKLYLIGGVGRNGISRGVKLWESGDGRNWIEVESLPEMMCKKFVSVCYHNYERVYCFWHQEMVCICCYTWPEILYCRVSRRTWHWLPKCPSLPEKWSCGFRWFSFVPELYAAV
ncbi:hypothetical protein OIU84_013010 [Salix udensis]|uniref:F-box/kelch-repeat protein n=1 Tax=Salix udensis TaxID=889485 RepID=A0AAD6JH35_9ROSI|nr:hypothetical protein OIU84_013010 [Salix udensis]